ncbi:uncharacterized protein J8A68_003117 [[Candida] subhashii]|uniref:Uncharacterized protein n=1 Tax=[Candida] subhashii TaxID=561895 RepID=A0A8J5QJZ6_9ASCO|nr:uncharacterized protein J8A68_003117 [[Candida] subhashii]KAG7663369.1 hypothetical protein J8A68_003117 [[Candida] subhashii]
MLQQLQSPFSYSLPKAQACAQEQLSPPIFSDRQSYNTTLLDTPSTPYPIRKKQRTSSGISEKLSLMQFKLSMLDDSLVKNEVLQLVQDLIDNEQESMLPQRSFEEMIINTPPPSLEQHQEIRTPLSSNYQYVDCFQTPKERIIDWERNCPQAPKQPNFVDFQENDAIDFEQLMFDWESI